MKCKQNKKTNGFTLAEVLITLGIIGIVAAMTIPTLMQKKEEKELITRLKKAYSTLQGATYAAVADNGSIDRWPGPFVSWNVVTQETIDILQPYLKIDKRCDFAAGQGCFAKGVMYKRLSGANYSVLDDITDFRLKFKLADGTAVAYYPHSNRCSAIKGTVPSLQQCCGEFNIDVNGDKGPNVQGIDYFTLRLTRNGNLIPEGIQGDTGSAFTDATYGCQNKATAQGWACAAWVIQNENMDYLRCSDLNWGVKVKCD